MSLPILLLTALALVVPGTAFAAEETSGYNQEPPKPPTTTTTTTPTPTPTTGTSPESAEKAPAETTAAKSPEPTASSSPAEEKTLPFTGFDLRWSFAIGLVLMLAGFSIVGVQRRRSER